MREPHEEGFAWGLLTFINLKGWYAHFLSTSFWVMLAMSKIIFLVLEEFVMFPVLFRNIVGHVLS